MIKGSKLKMHPFGFWEVANKPSPEELGSYYAEKYYQEGRGSYDLTYSDDELNYFELKLKLRFSVVSRHIVAKGKRPSILDIGCGEGYALSYFLRQGWEVKGLDYSDAGVKSKNPQFLQFLSTGDVFQLIEQEAYSGNKYDVVWLQNVLEHVIDPIALLKDISTLVHKSGLAVVTVPNDFSVTQLSAISLGHVTSEYWVSPPDHLTYFNAESLKRICHETGWGCLQMLADLPVDWFLFNERSNYIKNPHLGKDARKACVQIENYLNGQEDEDAILRFWAALAEAGIGRNLTAFLRPDPSHSVNQAMRSLTPNSL